MKPKLFEFIQSDHQLYKQWLYGISDVQLHPIAKRITPPKDNRKKVVIVYPSFLEKHGIKHMPYETLVLILDERIFVTTYFSNHPDYLFEKEKGAEFQTIY